MKRLIIVLAMMAGLSGCVSFVTPDLGQQWDGRFSLSVQGNGYNENQTGRFVLTHDAADTTVLDLKSAIGTTVARIEQNARFARLQAVGIPTQQAEDLQTLMLNTLGFTVPVSGLQFWLRGQTVPGVAAQTKPDRPPYRQIEQSGWKVQYLAYENDTPKRIRLSRQASDQTPAISMTLVISAAAANPTFP